MSRCTPPRPATPRHRKPTQGLEDIKVGIIPNREGQILHNLLLDQLNPTGRSGDPKYQLNTTLTEIPSSWATRGAMKRPGLI